MGRGGGGRGCQDGCERRIEVFGKIHTKKFGGRSVTKGVRLGGRVGGVRVGVNAMLGVGVMWGMADVNQE